GPLSVAVDVYSVGPYWLITRRVADQRSTSRVGHTSPPVHKTSNGYAGSSGRLIAASGVRSTCVMEWRRIAAASGSPLLSPSPARTSVAPDSRASTKSKTDASKLNDAHCSTRECAQTWRRSSWEDRRLAKPACVTSTALG